MAGRICGNNAPSGVICRESRACLQDTIRESRIKVGDGYLPTALLGCRRYPVGWEIPELVCARCLEMSPKSWTFRSLGGFRDPWLGAMRGTRAGTKHRPSLLPDTKLAENRVQEVVRCRYSANLANCSERYSQLKSHDFMTENVLQCRN
jgi:hypothetical protein